MKPNPIKTIRILIADDHDIVRQGLRSLLESHKAWTICGEAATGAETIEKSKRLKPDVVILDVNMPKANGAEVTREIRQALPDTEVLVLTMDESPQVMHDLLLAGARGYVFKSDVGKDITKAVEMLSRHEHFFTSQVADVMYRTYIASGDNQRAQVRSPLTTRQKEVVRLLAEGKSNKEAAAALNISVKTVETHRHQIMRRLHMNSFSELVRYAVREGLVSQ
jgi:DNA-binding NarL/FixJ family response regulator